MSEISPRGYGFRAWWIAWTIGLMVINLLSDAVYTLILFAAMWAPADIARQYLLPGQSAMNPHLMVSAMYNVYGDTLMSSIV
jgi:hypothetical protein